MVLCTESGCVRTHCTDLAQENVRKKQRSCSTCRTNGTCMFWNVQMIKRPSNYVFAMNHLPLQIRYNCLVFPDHKTTGARLFFLALPLRLICGAYATRTIGVSVWFVTCTYKRDCIQYMHNVVVLFLETTMFLPASQLCRTRTVLKPGWQPHKATPAYWSRLHGIHVRWIPRTGCTASWRRLSKRAMHGSNQGQELPLVRDPSPRSSPRSFQS